MDKAPNEITGMLLKVILSSRPTAAWLKQAENGQKVLFAMQERIYRQSIVAEFTTGIEGALVTCVNMLLDDAYTRVDWDWLHAQLTKH